MILKSYFNLYNYYYYSIQIFIKDICQKLIKYNVIGPNLASDAFKPIRYQYQMLLHALFNQYRHLPAQITYTNDPTNSIKSSDNLSSAQSNIISNNNNDNVTSLVKNQFMFSRYHTDFIEIEKLASGGFGSVYKVIEI